MTNNVETVKAYWNSSPCQANLSQDADRRRYFEEISRKRYLGRDRHVPRVAQFSAFRGKKVLEVGCGIGTDGLEFAKAGAIYTGVDLTPNSVDLARERFSVLGVPGRFEVANAEVELPFADETFDHVYSFGVIHHSPNPPKIVDQIHRVLKKRGTVTVMLYNRTSINYYMEIMFLRRLFKWSLAPRFMPRVLSAVTGFERWKLEGHRKMMRSVKPMSKEQWVSMNTDGPFCPLARVYNAREAAELFGSFGSVRQEVWEFNVDHWPFVRRAIPDSLAEKIGHRWGWHRIIHAVKS